MINAQVAIMKRALDLWHLGFSQGILVLGLDNYKSLHSTLTWYKLYSQMNTGHLLTSRGNIQ
jgi:hypothetical protein